MDASSSTCTKDYSDTAEPGIRWEMKNNRSLLLKILAIKGPTSGIEGLVGAGVGGRIAREVYTSKSEQTASLVISED